MKILIAIKILSVALITTALCVVGSTQAVMLESVSKAVKESEVKVIARYRLETVEQDGIDKDATASTLKTRLSVKTGKFGNFNAKIEVDNVSEIGADNYNSTANGKTQYPVVADMKGTDLNQAYVTFYGDMAKINIGRQRINHNDHRFLGGVAWRQNEQTYDGFRAQFDVSDNFKLDTSYIFNVNRIFTADSGVVDNFHGNILAVNSVYQFNKKHKVAFYYYNMDFDDALTNSNRTLGATYNGKFMLSSKNSISLKVGFASQSDNGDNPSDYSASYSIAEINSKFEGFSFGVGYEVLGSDNGVGFKTPLATLHKFQGWVDKFLGTPGEGVKDTYFKVGTKLGNVKLSAIYHDLSAEEENANWGTELDLVAVYKVNKQLTTALKYASYDAEDRATDTSKLWFMATLKF